MTTTTTPTTPLAAGLACAAVLQAWDRLEDGRTVASGHASRGGLVATVHGHRTPAGVLDLSLLSVHHERPTR